MTKLIDWRAWRKWFRRDQPHRLVSAAPKPRSEWWRVWRWIWTGKDV